MGNTMPEDLRKDWGLFLNRTYKLWQKFWEPPEGEQEDAWWENFLSYVNDLWDDYWESDKPGSMEATMMLYAIVAGAETRANKKRKTTDTEHWARIQRLFAEKMRVPLSVEGENGQKPPNSPED